MDKKELYKQVDHKRWLMNNRLFNDTIYNDLFFYGSISHPNVRALEFKIDPDKRLVSYEVYLEDSDYKLVKKFIELSKSDGFFGLWRYKRMLQKYGNLDPAKHVNSAVKDFAGPGWVAEAEVRKFSEYDPTPYQEEESEDFGPGADAHQQLNGG